MDEDLAFLLKAFGGHRGCPSEEVLAAYLEGGLSRRARRALEEHLEQCPLCLREVRAAGGPSPARSSFRTRWAAAALLAVLLGGGVWFFALGSPSLSRVKALLAGGEVARAVRVLDSLGKGGAPGGKAARGRFLSLLLPPLPRGELPAVRPAPLFRGASQSPPRVFYPLGVVLEDRPAFHFRPRGESVHLTVWPLENRGKDSVFTLEAPPGRGTIPFPENRPSLEPGDYGLQIRSGRISRVYWFRVLPRGKVAALEREWGEIRKGTEDPFLRKVARIRFCLSRGFLGEAFLVLKGMDPPVLKASERARKWLAYLEKLLCSGS